MASRCHELDPDGDVELILRNPDAPFAEWDENPHAKYMLNFLETPIPVSTQVSEEAARRPNEKTGGRSKATIALFKSLDPGNESWTAQTPLDPEVPEPEPVSEEVETVSSESRNASNIDDDVEVRMRLSSKHLILASAFFKKMLQGPWEESRTHSLEASDWDAEALLILMNIIHGRHRAVPRSISLEMLAKISVLVDYYRCHEVVELFATCWILDLRPSLPRKYGRDLTLWLLISWVFSQEDLFKTLTKVAIRETAGPLQTMNLPIPHHLVAIIDQKRQEIIHDIISGLHDLILYFHTRTKCTFECSSILLGALTRQMQTKGLLNPKPTRPFFAYSVAGTTATVCDFQSPIWCDNNASYHPVQHWCSLESFMDATVRSFADGVEGLQLDGFSHDYAGMTGQ
ncbi:hypothetical protein PGQ11_006174 [Apiospora arundinis]|uniref:BTB domain-containing protein n=1 Tax=Apiospora arundinis TaxID=335852 RepID=A0ABR2ITB1_9PEZI